MIMPLSRCCSQLDCHTSLQQEVLFRDQEWTDRHQARSSPLAGPGKTGDLIQGGDLLDPNDSASIDLVRRDLFILHAGHNILITLQLEGPWRACLLHYRVIRNLALSQGFVLRLCPLPDSSAQVHALVINEAYGFRGYQLKLEIILNAKGRLAFHKLAERDLSKSQNDGPPGNGGVNRQGVDNEDAGICARR